MGGPDHALHAHAGEIWLGGQELWSERVLSRTLLSEKEKGEIYDSDYWGFGNGGRRSLAGGAEDGQAG
jgi:hypothetical protein